jgi:hypothetical protein
MKTAEAVLSVLALAVLLLGAAGTASAATPGYAAYSVQLSSMGTSHTITVNESVSATSNVSYDKLILGVVSGNSTFSYSRSINSSLDVSPFLPSITNQSFSFTSGLTSVSVSILKNGSAPFKFNGGSYDLTSYALATRTSYNGTTETIDGAISAFPSGLVYSVKLTDNLPNLQGLAGLGALSGTIPGLITPGSIGSLAAPALGPVTLTVTLLSTSLPLSGPSSSATEQAASIGIGAGAVVSVLALGLGVRYRHRHESGAQPKPEYSVD